MNPILAENQYGHGGLGHFLKPTDWKYQNVAPKGSLAFDWSAGYDVEDEISSFLKTSNFKLIVENQGQSFSCGGQAMRYYAEVLKIFNKAFSDRLSAKYIYAQVFQPGGGSFGGDLMSLVKNKGVSGEGLCPSYQDGQLPSELFMEQIGDISSVARAQASSAESANYSFLVDFDIDVMAQAVRDNHGIVIALFGQNNGTWLSRFPAPPTAPIGSALLWGHWLYVGKAIMINGVKYLVVLNSWGDQIGAGGWQLISEAYVNSGYIELGMQMAFGTPSYTFNADLCVGMTNADVHFLQRRLNQDPATMLSASGVGSPGNETYYFGALTKTAVIKYQNKNQITPAIGYVGSITRGVLNR